MADKPQPKAATGSLIIFTGPSGVGKGTLLKALVKRHPHLYVSISATTRSPRPGEVHGQHYYFVSREHFQHMMMTGELLEWAEFAGNFYGTPKQAVIDQVHAGQSVVLEIELEGARQIHRAFPNACRIFILPPSIDELEHRIRLRGQDDDSAIAQRLEHARREIEAAAEFDVQIVNDDLEQALQQLEQVLFSEVSISPAN
ncbi:MAG: guanylate kinase [Cyanobacteria bacterium P01_A01_bin.123]